MYEAQGSIASTTKINKQNNNYQGMIRRRILWLAWLRHSVEILESEDLISYHSFSSRTLMTPAEWLHFSGLNALFHTVWTAPSSV
jgi:hypothetical protein